MECDAFMNDRFFTDSIQYQAVLKNLEQNNGQLKCAICGKVLTSKAECHFDHILAYSKGGKSTLDNCQILCNDCNLTKSDKDFRDFLLEEKAKKFMAGESISETSKEQMENAAFSSKTMSKEVFDSLVSNFINRKGDIKKVDFTREKNGLPSIIYVNKFYGSITNLKLHFGLKVDRNWDRESIWRRLEEYSKVNPGFKQKDLIKANDLPSLPCVLTYFPEYKNFNDIKKALGLEPNYEVWTIEEVEKASKEFLQTHNKITLKDLKKENGLPTSKVIYRFYGTMENYQKQIGSVVSAPLAYISKEEIIKIVDDIKNKYGSIFGTRKDFLKVYPHGVSSIYERFGSFNNFLNETGIKIINAKKSKFAKQEVDDLILNYLKAGNRIPKTYKELKELNLPSMATIMRFYESWREPFLIFSKILDISK